MAIARAILSRLLRHVTKHTDSVWLHPAVLACGPAVLRLVHKHDLEAGGVCCSQDPVDGPKDGLVVDTRLRLQSKLCQIGCVAVVIVVSLQRERTTSFPDGKLSTDTGKPAATAANHSTALHGCSGHCSMYVQGGYMITSAKNRKVLKPAFLAVPKVYCRKV